MGDPYHVTRPETPKAILVAVVTQKQTALQAQEYLEELAFLASTLGVETQHRFTQKMEKPDTTTFVGTGKLAEIKQYILDHETDWVIFDDELTPAQARNIEKELEIKILDRSFLILEIFLSRAKSAQARTQVELARNQYLLPRLRGMWTHLERQRGGTGTRGGAGEMEIETDRRVVRDLITLLKEKLSKIDQQKITQRKARVSEVRVAIVGYTNVGKSTLMNQLSKADVFAENKLFATIDSTVRKVVYDQIPFLLTDTVGFIRKLPHQLIECFKSTLDEVREADILLHVVDVAHLNFEEHIEVVEKTLFEIKASDKKVIFVFNKIDAFDQTDEEERLYQGHLEGYRKLYGQDPEKPAVFISASKNLHIDELRAVLTEAVKARYYQLYPNYLNADFVS